MNPSHNAFNAFPSDERLCGQNAKRQQISLSGVNQRITYPLAIASICFGSFLATCSALAQSPVTAPPGRSETPVLESPALENAEETPVSEPPQATSPAQADSSASVNATENASEADGKGANESPISDLEAARLISKLASPKFAEREKALVEIVDIGMPMVPHLRRAIANSDDPELKQRSTVALVHLTSGHFEAKVADFLNFKNDGSSFDGWLTASSVLGDTAAVRDLFIQILRAHPQIVASLDGTTRDRNLAIEQAAQTIQTNMFQNRIFPSLADGVALLLPLSDPNVNFSVGFESTLISVLQKHMAELRQDAGLNGPVSKLLEEWVSRSRVELRNETLWWAMQWDITSGATLGVRTLSETTDTETLQTAFQAIARFGTKSDAKLLVKYIRDPRPAVSNMPSTAEGEPLQALLGDVALAAIAVLHQKPMKEIGMPYVETHPTIAFLIDNVGYPATQPDARKKAQELAESWIRGIANPEKQGS